MRKVLLMLGLISALVLSACSPEISTPEDQSSQDEMMEEAMVSHVEFKVRVENIAGDETILLAPGVWVLFDEGAPIFAAGEADRGFGLETLAEDGDPSVLSASLGDYLGVVEAGVFNTPSGASEPGPLSPEGIYEFEFHAEDGQRLGLATMYVQSNDLFYAPESGGIELFDEAGRPLKGEITGSILLWDAGTEVNQTPGEGSDQAPRQTGAETGEDEMGVIRLVDDGFAYPNNVIKVTISTLP